MVWERKSLGSICEILDSLRRPVTKKDRRSGEYPYYGATGIVDYVDEFIFDEPLVLVGEDGAKWGSGERTAFSVCGPCWVNNHAHVLRPMRTKLLDEWLVYYLVHEDLTPFVSGLTVPKLNQGNLREIPVPVPPLPEQRRIVTILDEAFEAIAKAKANNEKNLQSAHELFKSEANGIFLHGAERWPTKTVDQISTNLDSKRIPITKSDRKAGEFPYYGASGIVDYVADYIFDGDTLLVSEDGANLLARSTPIAFSVSGRYWVNNHAHILKFPNMATQKFVEFYLESIPLDEYITGAAQPKLNQKALNSIPIPIPDTLDEQAEVVGRLERGMEQSEQLQGVYERKLAALDELKKSILHQAFTGQLTAKSTDQQLEAVA